jgi:hypothetical protein
MLTRPYTSKQMGDSCEMLVAAELTLAGVPAMKMPDNWPCYDVIAQPRDGGPAQRISVKSRTFKRGGDTFVVYDARDQFDWLAIVLLPGADTRWIADSSSFQEALRTRRHAEISRRPKLRTTDIGDKTRFPRFSLSLKTTSAS